MKTASTFAAIFLLLLLSSCNREHYGPVVTVHGRVNLVDWQTRMFQIQTDQRAVMTFHPCDRDLPVWVGAKMEISYRKYKLSDGFGGYFVECDQIQKVIEQ